MYLTAEEIRARVSELGAEIARDYEGREPILVASLKTSVFFLADLSRALEIPHAIDFVALAGYAGRTPRSGVRLIKDLDASITGRDVLLVEDVVDTGLTLNYVCKTFGLRDPASLNAIAFLDRPIGASSTTYPCSTSASRCRTSSSSATASTSTSATGTCRISTWLEALARGSPADRRAIR